MQPGKNTFRIVLLSGLVTASSFAFSQSITKPDASDQYIQHRVMKKGQQFFFTNDNMTKRNNLAQFDNTQTSGDYPSFKIDYTEKKQENIFFRSRHPLAIQPYTQYELNCKFRAADVKGQGPVLELVGYDETRETLVESHPLPISGNQGEWKELVLPFTTLNKARFARLVIKAPPGSAGNVLIGDIVLKQVSEPLALKPTPAKIIEKAGWKSSAASFASAPAALKADKSYYAISLRMKWEQFSGRIPVKLEWLADKDGPVIASDQFPISSVEGIQPQWNGVQVDWKREGTGNVDFVSRGLEKFFNGSNKAGGSAQVVFKADKPAGANFVQVIIDKPAAPLTGSFEMESLAVDAEY